MVTGYVIMDSATATLDIPVKLVKRRLVVNARMSAPTMVGVTWVRVGVIQDTKETIALFSIIRMYQNPESNLVWLADRTNSHGTQLDPSLLELNMAVSRMLKKFVA